MREWATISNTAGCPLPLCLLLLLLEATWKNLIIMNYYINYNFSIRDIRPSSLPDPSIGPLLRALIGRIYNATNGHKMAGQSVACFCVTCFYAVCAPPDPLCTVHIVCCCLKCIYFFKTLNATESYKRIFHRVGHPFSSKERSDLCVLFRSL